MKAPKLVPIDLSKIQDCMHPDIKVDETTYLAKIEGYFYVGTFSRE